MRDPGLKVRIGSAIAGVWLLVAIVWASQTVLSTTLAGTPQPFAGALRQALVNTVPWIPVTLAVAALAARYPLTRTTWRRALPIHVAGFVLLTYVVNVLVVLGYWLSSGNWGTPAALIRNGAYWTVMRVHVAALVYIAIAAATQGIGYYRETRARELRLARVEGQLARARLDALVAQIRPHFLFNTLHTIGQLWRSGRSTEGDAMLDHLGDLFQRVQRSTAHALVALDDELDMVSAYLAIEQARFEDRLSVTIDAADDVRALAVPPLLLQPIVENAIRHGIAASSSASRVAVAAAIAGDRLVLTVDDDGPGIDPAAEPCGTGTGLRTTRERLEQLFPGAHALRVDSAPGRGTRVTIEIPVRAPDAVVVEDERRRVVETAVG